MLKRDRSALLIGGVLLFSTGQAIAQPLRPIPIWSAKEMQQACDQALESAKLAAQEIRNTKIKNDLVATLLAFDQLGAVAQDAASVASLMMSTSPDASLRSQASDCTKRWNAYATELYQDRSLFDTLNLQGGDSIDRKLQADLKRRFESSGVQLDQEAQMRLRAIRKEMTELSLEFEKVLRDNTTTLAFTAEEARGVPLQVLEKAKKDAQGRYLLGFSYPEYQPFMDNAHDDAAKKRYYIAFTNRGGDRNIEILARLVELRESLAQLLGHRSYPAMITSERMVERPERVLSFLKEVQQAAEPREAQELEEIRLYMRAKGAQENLSRWNVSYWQEQLRKERYQIDQEQIRAYFPTQTSIAFSLDVASRLYDVDFRPVKLPTWHKSVSVWEVRSKAPAETDEPLGLIYLDLFPRPGKFTHAAAFPTRGVSRALQRKPISVMVANFNESGLTYGELRTLLHEFGHVLHGVLSDTRYLSHAGTSVERDFVEAPSQMFEAWAQSYESLKLLSDRCSPSCKPITQELVDRLEASRRFGQGIRFNTQRLYAAFDMQLHTVEPGRAPDPMETWKSLQLKTALGYVEGTKFPSAFGHIAGGYAVGYYGYLWAEVIAWDMRTAFDKNLMNTRVGRRYRDTILSRGSERKAADMVQDFLGRSPSTEAFYRELNSR